MVWMPRNLTHLNESHGIQMVLQILRWKLTVQSIYISSTLNRWLFFWFYMPNISRKYRKLNYLRWRESICNQTIVIFFFYLRLEIKSIIIEKKITDFFKWLVFKEKMYWMISPLKMKVLILWPTLSQMTTFSFH